MYAIIHFFGVNYSSIITICIPEPFSIRRENPADEGIKVFPIPAEPDETTETPNLIELRDLTINDI